MLFGNLRLINYVQSFLQLRDNIKLFINSFYFPQNYEWINLKNKKFYYAYQLLYY